MGSCLTKSRQLRHAILFIHVSKSGGTSLCQAALKERCVDPATVVDKLGQPKRELWSNCWNEIPFDDGPRWVRMELLTQPVWFAHNATFRAANASTCAQRAHWAAVHQATFMAIEDAISGPMVEAELCRAQFITIILVRDVIQRIHSHYREIVRESRQLGHHELLDAILLNPERTPCVFNVSRMIQRLDLITDNYYTRTLAGEEVYWAPLGAVTSKNAHRALQVLSVVDWVLPLESPQVEYVLTVGLGWQHGLCSPSCSRVDERRYEFASFSSEDTLLLQSLNGFDMRVHAEAQRLHQRDVISLHKLQENAPQAVGPALGSSVSWACCGFACTSHRHQW